MINCNLWSPFSHLFLVFGMLISLESFFMLTSKSRCSKVFKTDRNALNCNSALNSEIIQKWKNPKAIKIFFKDFTYYESLYNLVCCSYIYIYYVYIHIHWKNMYLEWLFSSQYSLTKSFLFWILLKYNVNNSGQCALLNSTAILKIGCQLATVGQTICILRFIWCFSGNFWLISVSILPYWNQRQTWSDLFIQDKENRHHYHFRKVLYDEKLPLFTV